MEKAGEDNSKLVNIGEMRGQTKSQRLGTIADCLLSSA